MNDITEFAAVYYPKDALSVELCYSIMNKTRTWLDNMEMLADASGAYGKLRWNFAETNSTIVYSDGIDFIQLWCDIEPVNGVTCCGTRPEFEHLGSDLTAFAAMEKKIYDELEKFQEEFYRTGAITVRQLLK